MRKRQMPVLKAIAETLPNPAQRNQVLSVNGRQLLGLG